MVSKFLGIFVLAAMMLSPYAASARPIQISGTHSQGEIQNTCNSVGGTSYSNAATGTYGCSKGKNVVACQSSGKCVGSVPRKSGPSGPTLGGVLGSRPVRSALSKRVTVSSKSRSNPVNETPVRGGTERGGRRH
jgi:hypothetical protein